MNDQITTIAELDALPVGSIAARICSDGQGNVAYSLTSEGWCMSTERIDAPRISEYDQVGNHIGPLTVLYRPDAPERTAPTEEQVAWAIAGVYGETCAWGREKGRVCGLCDCNGMTEAYARQAAHAVLDLLPQRVAPSEEEIARAIFDVRDGDLDVEEWEETNWETRERYECDARAVQKLYASQPTVTEVRAQALKEMRAYIIGEDSEEWTRTCGKAHMISAQHLLEVLDEITGQEADHA